MSHNDIADRLFEAEFFEHFDYINKSTQDSAPLITNVFANSQIVCLKKHKGDEKCICSTENSLDRLVFHNRVVPISKKRKSTVDAVESQNEVKKQKKTESESPYCLPFEQNLYVSTLGPNKASANLYYCMYILQSVSKPRRTYCGITNNRQRRLRQHNGELKGGAKQTRANRPWRMIIVLNGFESKDDAQRFEWSMHHPKTRKLRTPYYGAEGRKNCIMQLLTEHQVWRDRFTNQPINVVSSNVVTTGTVQQCKTILETDENAQVFYSPSQLRLYESDHSQGSDNLSTLSLRSLELYFCQNS